MKCEVRMLNYASLVMGLMSFGALSLAVATDFWLYTSEPVTISLDSFNSSMDGGESPDQLPVIVVNCYSGLWRFCVFYPDGRYMISLAGKRLSRIPKVPGP